MDEYEMNSFYDGSLPDIRVPAGTAMHDHACPACGYVHPDMSYKG